MPDFWPITPPFRSAVMTHTVDCALHEQNERHALAAIRLLIAASGLPAVSGPPMHAHYSPGVDVEVFSPQPV